MKRLLFLSIVCVIFTATIAQQHARDSVIQVLQTQKQEANRVQSLITLASMYNLVKPDTTVRLAVEAFELSKLLSDKWGIRKSLQRIGMGYHIMGNYSKALTFYLQTLPLTEQSRDTATLASLYNLMGHVYMHQENYEEALKYMHNGLALGEDLDLLAHTCEIFVQLKHVDSARHYGQRALALAYKEGEGTNLGWALFEMAYVHLIAEQYRLALEYFRMSIPITLHGEDFIGLCKEYRGIAQVFWKLNQRDSSVHYGRLALTVATRNNMLHEAEKASTIVASFYRTEHNADSALFYMDQSRKISDSLFSYQNRNQVLSLTIDEKLRQIEKEEVRREEIKSRKQNLQFAAIAIALVSLVIAFLVISHSIVAKPKLIKILGVISLLIVFEFLNLLFHPYLAGWTHHSPVLMLLAMVGIAALLVPLHHKLEHWVTQKLVAKNNRIRLAAAKKTIAELEGKA